MSNVIDFEYFKRFSAIKKMHDLFLKVEEEFFERLRKIQERVDSIDFEEISASMGNKYISDINRKPNLAHEGECVSFEVPTKFKYDNRTRDSDLE